jgi:hypothetical protein
MKKVLLAGLVTLGLFAGCSDDKLKVIHNNDRVTDLERRAALNDELNEMQNNRLVLLEQALSVEAAAREAADSSLAADLQAEMDARIEADQDLADLLAQEQAAREAGDDDLVDKLALERANRIAGDVANSVALAISVLNQSITNMVVQGQLSLINNKLTTVNNKINSLTNRMNQAESDINNLESDMADLRSDMNAADALLSSRIDTLSAQQAATQAQLNQEGVKVFKCGSPSSTERIFKINGKFYAAMNRVTMKTVAVVTGSSSQTYNTPDMCETFSGDLQLPNAGGQCTPNSGPFKSTKIPGQTVVVPAYTTANVALVDSVKIALDLLKDNVNYATTDGAAACVFSVNGSSSTNLVQVQ